MEKEIRVSDVLREDCRSPELSAAWFPVGYKHHSVHIPHPTSLNKLTAGAPALNDVVPSVAVADTVPVTPFAVVVATPVASGRSIRDEAGTDVVFPPFPRLPRTELIVAVARVVAAAAVVFAVVVARLVVCAVFAVVVVARVAAWVVFAVVVARLVVWVVFAVVTAVWLWIG